MLFLFIRTEQKEKEQAKRTKTHSAVYIFKINQREVSAKRFGLQDYE